MRRKRSGAAAAAAAGSLRPSRASGAAGNADRSVTVSSEAARRSGSIGGRLVAGAVFGLWSAHSAAAPNADARTPLPLGSFSDQAAPLARPEGQPHVTRPVKFTQGHTRSVLGALGPVLCGLPFLHGLGPNLGPRRLLPLTPTSSGTPLPSRNRTPRPTRRLLPAQRGFFLPASHRD